MTRLIKALPIPPVQEGLDLDLFKWIHQQVEEAVVERFRIGGDICAGKRA
jgi:hypothetical protein